MVEKVNIYKFYKNKKILITGHTGFKGSWLTAWFLKIGSKVVGISKGIPTKPSNFLVLNLFYYLQFLEFSLSLSSFCFLKV